MSKPITRIELTSFRGATQPFPLDFDPSKDFTMLFGENGSGKSSILDAIDVIVNGGFGVLEDISIGHSAGKYLCTLGCSPGTLKATVHSGGESWTGTMERNKIICSDTPAKPVVKILRRNKITDLIIAQPKERYEALKRFIDIGIVEKSESSLKNSLDEVREKISRIIVVKDSQEHQLDQVWKAENCPGPGQSAMEWAKHRVDTGIVELKLKLENANSVLGAVNAIIRAKNELIEATNLVGSRHNELSKIDQIILKTPDVKASTAIELIESLTKVKSYIDLEEKLDVCPTCHRPIKRDELIKIVDAQLKTLKELKDLNDKRNLIKHKLDIATANLSKVQKTFLSSVRYLRAIIERNVVPEINSLCITWPKSDAEPRSVDRLIEITKQIEGIKIQLELNCNGFHKDVNQFTSISEWHKGINDAKTDLSDLDHIRTGLQKAIEIVHSRRLAFVQSILDEITQEANRLLQAIHPGENISIDQLKMDEDKKGSVEQTGTCHGFEDVPPQAVFSESHLDTLGFCVWLAQTKRENPENTVLLIDDIFSSVDGPHLDRLMDLFLQEAPNFLQIIIATHYRLWWDRCQNAQGVQRIQLGLWTHGNGICAQNMPMITEELRQLAEKPILDRQAVSSKAGILLEDVLDGLALLYERSLPRNKQNLYTLGALVTACKKLYSRNNLTVQRNMNWDTDGQPEDWQPVDSKMAFDRIDRLQFIRNQVGCHFNPPGTEIPDGDVREFGRAAVELVDALTCPNCGYLATKPLNDGTALRCSCNKKAIRMTPVAIM